MSDVLDYHFYHPVDVRASIQRCSDKGHVQQVAFSTYHYALTQICFTCKSVVTSIDPSDLNE